MAQGDEAMDAILAIAEAEELNVPADPGGDPGSSGSAERSGRRTSSAEAERSRSSILEHLPSLHQLRVQ